MIGKSKYIYDLWGDTVNLASRMESTGVPGAIQVTRPVYEQLKDKFVFEPRGAIEVKGKGKVEALAAQAVTGSGHKLVGDQMEELRRVHSASSRAQRVIYGLQHGSLATLGMTPRVGWSAPRGVTRLFERDTGAMGLFGPRMARLRPARSSD